MIWRWFSLIYGINVVISIAVSCTGPLGKYYVVLNYSPEKYYFPYIIMGIILMGINTCKLIINMQMFRRAGEVFDYQ